jgi:hypothetical protein
MGGPGKPETDSMLNIRYFNPHQGGFQAKETLFFVYIIQ